MGSALSDYRHPDRSKMYVSLRSTLANNHLNAASKGKKIFPLKNLFQKTLKMIFINLKKTYE